MENKLVYYITKVGDLVRAYADSAMKMGEFKVQARKTLSSIILLIVLGTVVVLCAWLSILMVIFFSLTMIPLTNLQAMSVIVGINIFLLFVLLIWFSKTKRKMKRLKTPGAITLLNYILIILKGFSSKQENNSKG